MIRVGLYQETILSYEVVLGDGSVVTVTKDNEYSDLYYCLPWSHGTLGKCENSRNSSSYEFFVKVCTYDKSKSHFKS